jgi:tetratricopeptide (TPR) repeat protein
VNPASFQSWRKEQATKAPKTLNEYLAMLSTFWTWLRKQSRVSVNPFELVERADTRGKDRIQRRALSDAESARLLQVAGKNQLAYMLMQEAMEKYPNDPQVDFRAALDKDLPPEQQRQWLNAFEQSAPNNSLANYLSAMNYFSSGQNDQAVQELNAAAAKSQFQDYTLNSVQTMEDAYLSAGYSGADAGMLAEAQTRLPQVAALKQLGLNVVSLANSYQQSGDSTSAQAALQMAVNLGRNLDDNESGAPFLINTLAGMNIEYNALKAMDPNSPFGSAGQTVQDQLNQIIQQKAALKDLNDQFNNSVVPVMSQQDWISFQQRQNIFGEAAAQQWFIGKYGQP